MLRKIINILTRFFVGLFIVYLFLGFIVIPIILSWGIQKKGSELLKHPVTVADVGFNPILLKLVFHDLKIFDQQGQIMVGFHKFMIDLSFKALLKKKLEVEEVYLDGLKVNTVLQTQNRLNLLELIPQGPANFSTPTSDLQAKEKSTSQPPSQSQNIPLITFDRIHLQSGEITFRDTTIAPEFLTSLNHLAINIVGLSTDPGSAPQVSLQANLNQDGHLGVELKLKPFVQPLELETSVQLNAYALAVLTPYVGKYTGRSLKDGKLDFKIDYRIGAQQLAASHKILIQHFEFGDKVESKDALPLPFGLAVALLEDPQGRINISLPVKGNMNDPQFEYWHLVGQVARNFLIKLVTKPFTMIGSILGSDSGTEELAYARFAPGRSELSVVEQDKLKKLVKGLNERPKLVLEIPGAFDAAVDWKAIKSDWLSRDYDRLRKESTKNELWIYQSLYQRRFGVRKLWRLTGKYKLAGDGFDELAMLTEMKRQLIEDSPVDNVAVQALALARAKAVYDFLVAQRFDLHRASILPAKEVVSSLNMIPLEFSLTVVGQEQKAQ